MSLWLYPSIHGNSGTMFGAKVKFVVVFLFGTVITGLLYFNLYDIKKVDYTGPSVPQKKAGTMYKTFNGNHSLGDRTRLGESTSFVRRTTSSSKFDYRNMSTSQKLPWQYDKRFKNPCWYEDDVLKCLPHCYIVGTKKCGTTTLYSKLVQHPQFVNPGFKESQFFSWKSLNGRMSEDIYNYINMYSRAAKQIEEHSRNQSSAITVNKKIFCDATGSVTSVNFMWRKMPSNAGLKEPKYVNLDYIHRLVPTAKVIFIIRDPVDRYYSDYYFSIDLHVEKSKVDKLVGPEHFHQFAKTAIANYNRCLERNPLRVCVYDPKLYTYAVSLSPGLYHVYWEELLRTFPRKQIHLLQTNDLNSKHAMKAVFKFLELSPVGDDAILGTSQNERRNTRRERFSAKGPMLNSTRRMLYDFYRPYNERMAALTGNKDFLFPSDI